MATTHIVVVGIDQKDHSNWDHLEQVSSDVVAFTNYAKRFERDGILRIVDATAQLDTDLSADSLRKAFPVWLAEAGPDDRVVVFWSGHGATSPNDKKHYLITPDSGEISGLSTANAVATTEFTAWVTGCHAKSVLLIFDCCYAGEGGFELAAELDRALKESGPVDGQRAPWDVLVSSVNTPANDGAFMAAFRAVVDGYGPHKILWSRDHIRVDELAESLEKLSHNVNHRKSGGAGSAYLPVVGETAAGLVLPPSAQRRIRAQVERYLEPFGTSWAELGRVDWDVDGLTDAATRAAALGPSYAMVAHVLWSAAIGLEAYGLVSSLVSGLHGLCEDAWHDQFKGRSDEPRSEDYFEYFNYAARHVRESHADLDDDEPVGFSLAARDSSTVVEYVARVLNHAGVDLRGRRFTDWASERDVTGPQQHQLFNMLEREEQELRLVIDFVEEQQSDPYQPSPQAVGRLYRRDGELVGDSIEQPIDRSDPEGPAKALAAVYAVAQSRTKIIPVARIDVVLGIAELLTVRPAHVPVATEHAFITKPIGEQQLVVSHAGVRLYDPYHDNAADEGPSPMAWIDVSDDAAELYRQAVDAGPTIGLRACPGDLQGWAAALVGAPQVVWNHHNDHSNEHEKVVDRHRGSFPGCLNPTGTGPGDPVLEELHGVWTDYQFESQFKNFSHNSTFARPA